MKKIILKAKEFVITDIWKIDSEKLPISKKILITILKIGILSFKGFQKDMCAIRASALTFYSILSIVPVFAMGFGIAKGFGLDKILKKTIKESLAGHKEVAEYILSFSTSMLESAKGGLIAGISLMFLFWTVMKLLNHVEISFNAIWEAKKSRGFSKKFTDYFSIILIAPILVILSSSVTLYISSQLTQIAEESETIHYISPFIFALVKFIPYISIWALLALLYIVMPNVKVDIKSALIAGLFAGLSYQLLQWGYINFQVGVSRYSAIYGSFAALPLFLIWMQLSWNIILLGGEIAYSISNYEKIGIKDQFKISYIQKIELAIIVISLIINKFTERKSALTIKMISEKLKIPENVIESIIEKLVKIEVISKTVTENSNIFAFQPAIDINIISVSFVVDKLNNNNYNELLVIKSKDFERISNLLENYNKKISDANSSMLIKDI